MKRDTKIAIITFITLGVTGLIALGAYRFIQKKKAKKADKKIASVPHAGSVPSKTIDKDNKVDLKAKGVVKIKTKIAEFNDIFKTFTVINNQLHWRNGVALTEEMKISIFMLITRTLESLVLGVNADKSMNQETKDYSLKLLSDFEKTIPLFFPVKDYNTSIAWYVEKSKKIEPIDYYNA